LDNGPMINDAIAMKMSSFLMRLNWSFLKRIIGVTPMITNKIIAKGFTVLLKKFGPTEILPMANISTISGYNVPNTTMKQITDKKILFNKMPVSLETNETVDCWRIRPERNNNNA